jgi:NADPH2:quinone reductase
VADAEIVARKPPSLSHAEAAAVPLAGGTAWEVVVRGLAVGPGETVLIHGGAGGVGSFAVQFAKVAGAGDRHGGLARAGHATPARRRRRADYRAADVRQATLDETGGAGADAVCDFAGGDTIARSIPATRPFGRLATILGAQGDLTGAYTRNQLTLGSSSPASAGGWRR